jgi:hypothetical protein
MTRAKSPQNSSLSPDLFGDPETQPQPKPCSDTTRESGQRKALESMARAFRSLESFRTMTWMRIERGESKEAVEVLRDWENAVRHTREEYERLTG